MAQPFYCVAHAEREELVRAVDVRDGRTACRRQSVGPVDADATFRLGRDDATWCVECEGLGRPYIARFVVDNLSLCVRHASDAVYGDDGMGAHDMAHATYLELKRRGITESY